MTRKPKEQRLNPEPKIITDVKFIRAVDVDTYEVEVSRRFNVRLRNIDGFEHDTDKGKDGKAFVDKELSSAKLITISIPTNDSLKLMDVQSFERVVADVYYDGKDMVVMLDANGFRKPKGEERLG